MLFIHFSFPFGIFIHLLLGHKKTGLLFPQAPVFKNLMQFYRQPRSANQASTMMPKTMRYMPKTRKEWVRT